jgi:2-keto-4-pentenoate hydratase
MQFWADIRVGDSSSPMYFLINNQVVLHQTLTGGDLVITGGFGGPDIARFGPRINAMLTSMGDPEQLSIVNLSGFPTYY